MHGVALTAPACQAPIEAKEVSFSYAYDTYNNNYYINQSLYPLHVHAYSMPSLLNEQIV